MTAAQQREAERQRALMHALAAVQADAGALAVRQPPERALRGLQAYRANASAAAERALATAYPTVQAMLGDEDFARLAREHWREVPAVQGDLGEWGGGLAAWIEAHAGLADWPWLADCARVDWARHRCERAADGALDAGSLNRLGDADPMQLHVVFADGFALVESRWPVATIHRAHRGGEDDAFASARAAIAQGLGESVVVARVGLRGEVGAVDAIDAGFVRGLLAGETLGVALARADAAFDFSAWLTRALQSSWLKGLVLADD